MWTNLSSIVISLQPCQSQPKFNRRGTTLHCSAEKNPSIIHILKLNSCLPDTHRRGDCFQGLPQDTFFGWSVWLQVNSFYPEFHRLWYWANSLCHYCLGLFRRLRDNKLLMEDKMKWKLWYISTLHAVEHNTSTRHVWMCKQIVPYNIRAPSLCSWSLLCLLTWSLTASSQTSSFFGHTSQPLMMVFLAVCILPVTSSSLAAAIQPGACFGLVVITDLRRRRAFFTSLCEVWNKWGMKSTSNVHVQCTTAMKKLSHLLT